MRFIGFSLRKDWQNEKDLDISTKDFIKMIKKAGYKKIIRIKTMKKVLEKMAISMAMVIIFGSIYALLALVYFWRVGGL